MFRILVGLFSLLPLSKAQACVAQESIEISGSPHDGTYDFVQEFQARSAYWLGSGDAFIWWWPEPGAWYLGTTFNEFHSVFAYSMGDVPTPADASVWMSCDGSAESASTIAATCDFDYPFSGTSTKHSNSLLYWYLEGNLDVQSGAVISTSYVDFLRTSDKSLYRRVSLVGSWSHSGILLSVAPGDVSGFSFTYEGSGVGDRETDTVNLWTTVERGWNLPRLYSWDWSIQYKASSDDGPTTAGFGTENTFGGIGNTAVAFGASTRFDGRSDAAGKFWDIDAGTDTRFNTAMDNLEDISFGTYSGTFGEIKREDQPDPIITSGFAIGAAATALGFSAVAAIVILKKRRKYARVVTKNAYEV